MAVLVVLFGYGLGTLPTAILVGARRGVDPTAAGSGNPGATNVYRTAGRRAGALVLLGDLAKGVVAATAGFGVDGRTLALAAGAAAVVGHVFPVQRRFRGGKGVATAAGAALVVHPVVTLVLGVVFGAVAKASGHASLGSITIAVLWPLGAAIAGRPGVEVALAAGVGVLVVVRHASNIGRLLDRREHGIESGGDPAAP